MPHHETVVLLFLHRSQQGGDDAPLHVEEVVLLIWLRVQVHRGDLLHGELQWVPG